MYETALEEKYPDVITRIEKIEKKQEGCCITKLHITKSCGHLSIRIGESYKVGDPFFCFDCARERMKDGRTEENHGGENTPNT
jgi:hypothetical protein